MSKNWVVLAGKQVIVLFCVTLLVVLISSCNLFFSSPHGRENINDPAAQITAFTAVPSGDNSVVTMWNWKDLPSWLNDERITEIKIQHSILGYPDNYIFFAGQSFTDNNEWQYEWDSLIPGITHYYSLFAKVSDKDKDDYWLAPLKAKAKLPGTYKEAQSYTIQTYEVDDTGPPFVTPGVLSTTVNGSFVLVLELGFPADVFVDSAYIDVGMLTTSGAVRIFPIIRDWDKSGNDQHTWDQLWFNDQYDYAVDDSLSMLVDTAGAANPSPIDITDIVRKTAISGPIEFIFKEDNSTPETVTINNMVDFLVINYYED